MRILVSACLMGMSCRYDGKSNQLPQLQALMKKHICIPVCAEMFGGLPTPRTPAERQGNRVVTKDGKDVTDAFIRGTAEILRLADLYHCGPAEGEQPLLRQREDLRRHLHRHPGGGRRHHRPAAQTEGHPGLRRV